MARKRKKNKLIRAYDIDGKYKYGKSKNAVAKKAKVSPSQVTWVGYKN